MSGHRAGTFSTPTGPATNRKHHQVAAVSPWTLMANGRMKTARQPDHISARKQPVGSGSMDPIVLKMITCNISIRQPEQMLL